MKSIMNLKIIQDIIISKPNFQNLTKKYKALIDTGATRTYVSNKVINELNLIQSNSGKKSFGNNKEYEAKLYICNILLEDHTKSCKLEVVDFVGRKECDIIIGMDLISHGELIIKYNEYEFIVPSLK